MKTTTNIREVANLLLWQLIYREIQKYEAYKAGMEGNFPTSPAELTDAILDVLKKYERKPKGQ